ncbi:common pilus major fimbrillin subunit EcpA [Pantoea sp. 1.19]|uniref:common pilus major fimbrillin subunit EcpA n=1 Tax=Pantoea sp. 1.19 TaxID=1925589 RepID=UPI000948FED4|nr:common pilus major fimbrillin subunit EcpA [Pantoea sp. 1.19]
MTKSFLTISTITALSVMYPAHAAQVTAQAVASWSATAKKDTVSKLVVTPLGSLMFEYADGIKSFNSQKGLFDVVIEGEDGGSSFKPIGLLSKPSATAFKLSARLLTNTLTQTGKSGSTLNVGVEYNGVALKKNADISLIDTAGNQPGGNLSLLAAGFNKKERASAQDAFTFSIISATSNGTTAVDDFSKLPDGLWSGDVSVQFEASWTS